MKQLLIGWILFLIAGNHQHAVAQQLSGIWSGKISRSTSNYRGVESIEVQINQSGKNLSGYSFAYKDTSRFVLYSIYGTVHKKEQQVQLNETGNAIYVLPVNFFPCEKFFDLRYYKIGKTQYLTGRWGAIMEDTSCFPGEDLLVVLQKVKKPEYPVDKFIQKKLIDYLRKQTVPTETPEVPDAIIPPATTIQQDSSLAERKLDIQEIIRSKDSTIKIYLYDNAEIDDDTVTVFVDKKPVLVKQRISAIPLVFEMQFHEIGKPMEIVLQADNLGSIPPNTALMIVETLHKRYEVRLSSSFEKHAVVIVTYDPGE